MDLLAADIAYIGIVEVCWILSSRRPHYELMLADFEHSSEDKEVLIEILTCICAKDQIWLFVGQISLEYFFPVQFNLRLEVFNYVLLIKIPLSRC